MSTRTAFLAAAYATLAVTGCARRELPKTPGPQGPGLLEQDVRAMLIAPDEADAPQRVELVNRVLSPVAYAQLGAELVVSRDGMIVKRSNGAGDFVLGAGHYALALVWPDRHEQVLDDFTLERTTCLGGNVAWHKLSTARAMLLAPPDGAPRVIVVRRAADYGRLHTRAEWRQGDEVVSEGTVEEAPDAAPDHAATGDFARHAPDHAMGWWFSAESPAQCRMVFRELRASFPIPDAVRRRSGRFVLRLVSPGARAYEIAVDVPRRPITRGRATELAMRAVPLRDDERQWQHDMEATYRVDYDKGLEPYAEPISMTPAVWRAVQRDSALAPMLADFMMHRSGGSGVTLDRASAIADGVRRGERIASIEARLERRQHELDEDAAARDAEGRRHYRALRARIVAMVAKEGARPFADDELP